MFWWDSNFEREMAWEVTEAISGKQTGNLDQSPSKLVPTRTVSDNEYGGEEGPD